MPGAPSRRSVVRMITAVHNLVYSDDALATREFLRDVLRWPFVTDDGTSPGASGAEAWLIFGTGPSELGVHGIRPLMQHVGEICRHQVREDLHDLCGIVIRAAS